MYVFNPSKTILQKGFQIGRPICKSAGQSVIGRLVSQFANWPDWQIGRNIDILELQVRKCMTSGNCTINWQFLSELLLLFALPY